ncbi:glycosyltransferase [Riemerella anatipestifer]|nr:glycosyltransferase [Riemerella anatipestifer]MDY3324218.1 glycosyltransferase [Riemerella anatipestifer]MDY3353033.1 glycosyltransferase [Riemerella anatipestifer]
MEKDIIKISIIIPVYNTPVKYLQECLESIRKANINCKYEVLIINDGSTDTEVISFLKKYSEESTTILHKQNTGVSATRNLGLDKTQGQFVLFLDSDDVLLPEINKVLKFLDNNVVYDVIYCDVPFFGDREYIVKKKSYSKFQNIYIRMLPSITSLIRKKSIGDLRFREEMDYGEDWDFWARLSSKGLSFFIIKLLFLDIDE